MAADGLMNWVPIRVDRRVSILESVGSEHVMKELIECVAANALPYLRVLLGSIKARQ
jgi:hypothetical protein